MNLEVQAAVRETPAFPQAPRGAMDDALQVLIDKSVRDRLELAARALETRSGNLIYIAAWRVAAKIIRAHKPD